MERYGEHGRSLKSLLAAWGSAVAGTTLPQPPTYAGPDIVLTKLTEKTSEVVPGACFVARVRETSDGHPYVSRAIEQGAALILAQKAAEEIPADIPAAVAYLQVPDTAAASAWLAAAWEGFPSRQLVVIGITGTDGKTTTANILLSMLRAAHIRAGLLSTTRAVIGSEEEALELHVTTPEAPVVQRHLRRMVDAGLSHCILEVTSHGLAQHRVTAVDFDLAAVTNVTHEHLDYHGDFERYLAAKARLFHFLGSEAWSVPVSNPAKAKQVKTAVLNSDDPSYAALSAIPVPRAIGYGIDQQADLLATDIAFNNEGTQFTLNLAEGLAASGQTSLPIRSPLPGRFNIYNTLAAAALALAVGAEPEAIREGVEALPAIDGRMERVQSEQPFAIIVDFAHTPNALTEALEAARRMTEGRIITIFGSAGKRDVHKRSAMARIAAQRADLTILTAEDPRTESLEGILQTMADSMRLAGHAEGETYWRIPDRGEAIHFGLRLAAPGDLVLICGKGHEQSLCFGTTEYPWDDRTAVEKALEALEAGTPMPDLGLPTYGA